MGLGGGWHWQTTSSISASCTAEYGGEALANLNLKSAERSESYYCSSTAAEKPAASLRLRLSLRLDSESLDPTSS